MIRASGVLLLLFTLSGISVAAEETASHAFPPEVQSRLQEVLDELRAVEEKMRPVRERVERGDELTATREAIDRDVLAAVEERSDEGAALAARRRALQQRLDGNGPDGNDSGDTTALRSELEEVRKALRPLIREVRETPDMSDRIARYEEQVERAMVEAAPEIREAIARRKALHVQFHRLQREALEGIRDRSASEASSEAKEDEEVPWVFPPFRRR